MLRNVGTLLAVLLLLACGNALQAQTPMQPGDTAWYTVKGERDGVSFFPRHGHPEVEYEAGEALNFDRFAQDGTNGVRGDSAAIAEAEAMVETMGGMKIWAQLESVHFVHEWYPWYRIDSYVENEILDLTAPRSWVERKSEIYHMIRAYSPEGKHWSVVNGKLAYASEEVFENAMERAPFNFYRTVRAIAIGDNLRVAAWGVYGNGTTRYEMISLKGSNLPPDSSLFLPPPEFRD